MDFLKRLSKKTKKGFRGYPIATLAMYGPDDKTASKIVVSIIAHEGAEPDPMEKWFSQTDIRRQADLLREVIEFISANQALTVVMADRIIGCPHEEGIDYPKGETCPECPFWHGKDRWSGQSIH
ncbi:MAG: hypothetical protein R8K50_10005 [Mariprofundus sp.]